MPANPSGNKPMSRGGLFGRRYEPPQHQIWDPFQDPGFGAALTTPHMAFPSQTPPIVNAHIESKETPEAYVYKTHLPGLKRDEVRVEVDDGRVLRIIGEKSVEKEEQRGRWHRVELARGRFVQRLDLPENAEVDHVEAYMDNGVLNITVPKHQVVKPRGRNIRISGH